MIGFNSRETYQDAIFDIQTQQLTGERVLETRIYRNGKILATVRRTWPEEEPVSSVHERMSRQHEQICEKVRDGNYALIFLWISRGIIHFEAGEYLKSLECFESVLAIDEKNAEVQTYLDEIRSHMQEDAHLGKSMKEEMEKQLEELAASGRQMESARKKALLQRLGLQAPSSLMKKDRVRGKSRRKPFSFPTLPFRAPAALVSGQLIVFASFLFLILCVGFIQADTQLTLHPDYHGKIADEYLKGGQVFPARNLYQQLILQDPGSRDALSGFWDTFHRTGDYPAAVRTLEDLTNRDQQTPWAHFCLGEAYRMSSRCGEAISCYREAVQRGVSETDGKIGWGLCLLQQNRTEEAIRLWEELQQTGEDNFRVDFCLGKAYQQQSRPGRASIYFTRALKKNPESQRTYQALADCLEGLHQIREAERLRDRADLLASVKSPPASDPLSVLPSPTGMVLPRMF